MLHLENTEFQNTADLIKEINNALIFYGFVSLDEFEAVWSKNKKTPKKRKKQLKLSDVNTLHLWERQFVSNAKYFSSRVFSNNDFASLLVYSFQDLKKAEDVVQYQMHAIDKEDAFAEAVLIFAFGSVIRKFFKGKTIHVEVNTMGDKDSVEKYIIDLTKYLKRNRKKLPKAVFEEYQNKNTEKAVAKLAKMNHPLLEDAPVIMNYLSENAKKHLYLFLNYLDEMEIDYSLNPYFFAKTDVWKHIIFNVYLQDSVTEEKELVAQGGRYDNALKKFVRDEKQIASLIFDIENKGRKKKIPIPGSKSSTKFFFVQIAPVAKAQATKLLQDFHNEGLSVEHTICNPSLLDQYRLAKEYGAKYILILGHKEALDETVIVRNVETQTQEIIKQPELIKKLKKMR